MSTKFFSDGEESTLINKFEGVLICFSDIQGVNSFVGI